MNLQIRQINKAGVSFLCLTTLACGLLNASASYAQVPTQVTDLHDFNLSTEGYRPDSQLVLGSDDLYYGVSEGGPAGSGQPDGAIFRIAADGSSFSIVHSFSGPDGAGPEGPLYKASDGALYGVTRNGGANGVGTVFKISADGASFSTIYNGVVSDSPSLYYFVGPVTDDGSVLYLVGSDNGDSVIGQMNFDGTGYKTDASLNRKGYEIFPSYGLVNGGNGYLYGGGAAGGMSGTYLSHFYKFSLTNHGVAALDKSGVPPSLDSPQFTLSPDGYIYTAGRAYASAYDEIVKIDVKTGIGTVVYPAGELLPASTVQSAFAFGADGYYYGESETQGIQRDLGYLFKFKPNGSDLEIISDFLDTDVFAPTGGLTTLPGGDSFIGVSFGDTDLKNNGSVFSFVPGLEIPYLDYIRYAPRIEAGIGRTLSVKGFGFVAGSQVIFNGSAVKTTYVSPTQLKYRVLPADIPVAGVYTLTVANPNQPEQSNSDSVKVEAKFTVTSSDLHRDRYTGDIRGSITVTNQSGGTVSNTSFGLGYLNGKRQLPPFGSRNQVGSVGPGESVTLTDFKWPGSAGASGTTATLQFPIVYEYSPQREVQVVVNGTVVLP